MRLSHSPSGQSSFCSRPSTWSVTPRALAGAASLVAPCVSENTTVIAHGFFRPWERAASSTLRELTGLNYAPSTSPSWHNVQTAVCGSRSTTTTCCRWSGGGPEWLPCDRDRPSGLRSCSGCASSIVGHHPPSGVGATHRGVYSVSCLGPPGMAEESSLHQRTREFGNGSSSGVRSALPTVPSARRGAVDCHVSSTSVGLS